MQKLLHHKLVTSAMKFHHIFFYNFQIKKHFKNEKMGKKKRNCKEKSEQMPKSWDVVNKPNKLGMTPLHIAAQKGHLSFCKVCIYNFTFTY